MDSLTYRDFSREIVAAIWRELDPLVDEVEETERLPYDLLFPRLKEMGAWGLILPEEYGGAGVRTPPRSQRGGHLVCGRCRNCMAGRRHLCAYTRGIGVNAPGAFAEYVALPMTNIWHHALDVPGDIAAIFDPLGNDVHAALSFPVLGEDVLITGAGPIGLMAAAVVRPPARGTSSSPTSTTTVWRSQRTWASPGR